MRLFTTMLGVALMTGTFQASEPELEPRMDVPEVSMEAPIEPREEALDPEE